MTSMHSVSIAKFIRDLLLIDSRWLQLMRFVIICFKIWDIIGSYNFRTCWVHALVIFYLQNLRSTPEENFIVPPIEVLQSHTEPKYHKGVNYAYDLTEIKPMTADHDVRSLIKGFFLFYSEFDFDNYIVSPFLGKAIPKDKFISGEFIFEAYYAQLRELTLLNDVPPKPLKVNQSISIQDFFSLNVLYNGSITDSGFNYFRLCINSAAHIFSEPAFISDSQLYQKLLYGIIERISKAIPRTTISIEPFSCIIKPNLMKILYKHVEHVKCLDIECLHKLWAKVIVEIVHEVLTGVFKLDVDQSTMEKTSPKIEKRENEVCSLNWILNGCIDVWTGATLLEKRAINYLDRLKLLVNTLEQQRRQNPTFAVKLQAVLKIRIENDSTIQIKIQPVDLNVCNLTKKSPLRKMFGSLCNILNAVTLIVDQKMGKISETELTNIIQSLRGNGVIDFNNDKAKI